MRQHLQTRRRDILLVVASSLLLYGLVGCGGQQIEFPYADESYVYPETDIGLARVHLGAIHDMRTADQREGRGHLMGITFPGDDKWRRPVTEIYREALTRDLSQTQLLEMTPLPAQADYLLEAEILSFHCRLERQATSFALPVMAGTLAGFVLGDDTGSRLKRAALFSVVAFGALPMPAHRRAEVIVRLVLRDREGTLVWERTCLGEIEGGFATSVTSRADKDIAERDLPLAVKRANACLLGQLRQFLISR